MTPERAAVLLKGQTTIAQKVYELVPMQEAWSVAQIHSEMVRQHGSSQASRVTHGCLHALEEAGLIKGEKGQLYQRRRLSKPVPIPKGDAMPSTVQPEPAAPTPARSSIDTLTAMSASLTALRASVTTGLTDMINKVDDVILDIEQEREDTSKLIAKAKQLTALMKEFS